MELVRAWEDTRPRVPLPTPGADEEGGSIPTHFLQGRKDILPQGGRRQFRLWTGRLQSAPRRHLRGAARSRGAAGEGHPRRPSLPAGLPAGPARDDASEARGAPGPAEGRAREAQGARREQRRAGRRRVTHLSYSAGRVEPHPVLNPGGLQGEPVRHVHAQHFPSRGRRLA